MGIVTRGIPDGIAIELAKLNGSTVFVESGTYHGDTTRWASEHFEKVYTIEREENLYEQYSSQLEKIKGVSAHLGNSKEVLPMIVSEIHKQKALFWLDGHWSGGETAGEDEECPLLEELACLSNRMEDIILIDDARLFLCAPPHPHKSAQWPTITDIVNVLSGFGNKMFIQVIEDVIFIIPDKGELKKHLVEYAQIRSNYFWEDFLEYQESKSSFKKRLLNIFR